jgi:hypothetical protein
MDMKKYSTSPERGSFYRKHWLEQLEQMKTSQDVYEGMMKMLDENDKREEDEDKTFNLGYDLRSNERMLSKARNSEVYCQQLYASLCNNQFFYGDKAWTCTWRFAGGIISDMIEKGDYIDWYCSGNEGFVTDEIKLDLMMMGWTVRDHDEYMNESRKFLKESNNEKESF